MSRIVGRPVRARFPAAGVPVDVMLFGEAPGPRGADKSGIPFWGDRAGKLVYAALEAAGLCALPAPLAELPWDGAKLRALGMEPRLTGAALSNAWPACPTDDGESFRAPTKAELESPANMRRLAREVGEAVDRGATAVVTMGSVAHRTIGLGLGVADIGVLRYATVRHPSAQSLMFSPERKAGMSLGDMERLWVRTLAAALAGA